MHHELHLIKTVPDLKRSVSCGYSTSECFNTDTGEPQGKCASENEFTHYLAKSLHSYIDNYRSLLMQQHIFRAIPDEFTEHNYGTITQSNHSSLDREYADSIFEVSSNYNDIRKIKDVVPKALL